MKKAINFNVTSPKLTLLRLELNKVRASLLDLDKEEELLDEKEQMIKMVIEAELLKLMEGKR